jgi:hypothetical protein
VKEWLAGACGVFGSHARYQRILHFLFRLLFSLAFVIKLPTAHGICNLLHLPEGESLLNSFAAIPAFEISLTFPLRTFKNSTDFLSNSAPEPGNQGPAFVRLVVKPTWWPGIDISVLVCNISGLVANERLELQCNPDESMDSFKDHIFNIKGIPRNHQRIFKDQELLLSDETVGGNAGNHASKESRVSSAIGPKPSTP